MLSLKEIKNRLWTPSEDDEFDESIPPDKICICPTPTFDGVDLGTVGLDLRLGSWFASFRETDIFSNLTVKKSTVESKILKPIYVPHSSPIVLQPGQFLLGVTLEWIRLPGSIAAHVIGKSGWGRRGLVIATATGVQPFFTGCLTLELANVGRAPLELRAGESICQLFLEEVVNPQEGRAIPSRFSCSRKPGV